MTMLKIFIASTVTGMGLAVGVGIILGWGLLIFSWLKPATKALTLYF